MKVTFNTYYNQKLINMQKIADRDKVSIKTIIFKIYGKTLEEYKEWQKSLYKTKNCYSFWRSECENKGIECYHCNKYYSQEEYDKLTKK